MVREVEMPYDLICAAQIVSERFVVCDAGEEHEPLGVDVAWVALVEDGLGGIISDGREEKVLLFSFLPFSAACRSIVADEAERLRPLCLLLLVYV